MKATVEIQYKRPSDGLAIYAEGVLTTEHPASSYGLPVLVVEYLPCKGGILDIGQVYGPTDLPSDYVLRYVRGDDVILAARHAMYHIAESHWTEGVVP